MIPTKRNNTTEVASFLHNDKNIELNKMKNEGSLPYHYSEESKKEESK